MAPKRAPYIKGAMEFKGRPSAASPQSCMSSSLCSFAHASTYLNCLFERIPSNRQPHMMSTSALHLAHSAWKRSGPQLP